MTYTVKEIAEKMGMTEHTIRFYTDRGLLPCTRDKNNRRVFDDESVNSLTAIQCLRRCGISVDDIKAYFDLCQEGDSALPARYEFMLKQRELARQKLEEAQRLMEYMDQKVRYYENLLLTRSGK